MSNTKTTIKNNKLGVVWKYILEMNLNGEHESMVDGKYHTDIITNTPL